MLLNFQLIETSQSRETDFQLSVYSVPPPSVLPAPHVVSLVSVPVPALCSLIPVSIQKIFRKLFNNKVCMYPIYLSIYILLITCHILSMLC